MERSQLIKEGAISLGVYLLFILITLLVPVLGTFTLLLLPVPFLLFTNRHGLRPAIFLALFSLAVLFIITGPFALPLILSTAAGGIVTGELLRRKKHAFGALLGGSLAFIAAILINYIGSIVLLGINPVGEIQNVLRESVAASEDMLGFMGPQNEEAFEAAYQFITHLGYIAPVMFVMFGAGYAFVVQWISSLWMRKKSGYITERFPPFREWSFPKSFIWYYLLTFILIFTDPEEGTALFIATANLMPLLEAVMIIQGFAFIFFFFHKKGRSVAFPIIIMIISFLLPLLLTVVRILGIIDLGFDLRKRMNSQK
ncbi:YybS family protein [Evansella clarkii]|uniref:YybS family protein n=1 Tax=Evansella clarkii TaxID=79879 RepID=UPI000B42F9D4|nr:YybS family protein [Evansella clarkii]